VRSGRGGTGGVVLSTGVMSRDSHDVTFGNQFHGD
jgi:hypothetical protein